MQWGVLSRFPVLAKSDVHGLFYRPYRVNELERVWARSVAHPRLS